MSKPRVQDTPRVDAVAVSYLDGAAFFTMGGHQALAVHEAGADFCDLCIGGRRGERLQLVRLQNGYHGQGRTVFLCPVCGGHARHVYVTGAGFRCRKCAGLCYQSQLTHLRRSDRLLRRCLSYLAEVQEIEEHWRGLRLPPKNE